jgi:ELWxxDGT repeat protein
LTRIGTALAFWADDGSRGTELWRTNGTHRRTRLAANINPGPSGSIGYHRELLNASGTLFFAADDGTHGDELWKFVP